MISTLFAMLTGKVLSTEETTGEDAPPMARSGMLPPSYGHGSASVAVRSLGLFAVCSVIIACAGSGVGLDENGNPPGPGGGLPVAFDPTFANIQQQVFTPICTACHAGAGAPQGLMLDEAHSYDMLRNVPSAEKPDLYRVLPGDPNSSYLVRKLEGGPDIVGAQMPLGRTPLSQPTINAIRVWIAKGAPHN
ncbi:MAG: hypothetical protein AB1714_02955 [Acidobacteriota bacterium]